MSGDSGGRSRISSSGSVRRGRSMSNVSSTSTSSMASVTSDNSFLSDNFAPGFHHEGNNGSKTHHGSTSESSSFLNVKQHFLQRSRSHSRGRNSSHGSITGHGDDSKLSSSSGRTKPRSSQGHVYQLLTNLKPFSRESKDSRSTDHHHHHNHHHHHEHTSSAPSSHTQISVPPQPSPQSPQSPQRPLTPSTRRSIELSSASDSEEAYLDRGRKTLRNSRGRPSERSESPSCRKLKIFPSFSALVQSSSNNSDQASSSSITGSALRALSRRSRSSSRSKLDEAPEEEEVSAPSAASTQPALPPLQVDLPGNLRRSSSTIRSHISAASDAIMSAATPPFSHRSSSDRFKSTGGSSGSAETGASSVSSTKYVETPTSMAATPETELLRHAALPDGCAEVVGNNPATPKKDAETDSLSHKSISSLQMSAKTQHSHSTISNRDKLCFLRVYRPDGTFGTIACPIDISVDHLLQLAARKFFITDAKEYQLVALRPDSVRILSADAMPAQLIRNLLIHAGYHSTMDRLNDVSRDDTSFLCRIVLANINEPLRPPLLMQGLRDLVLVDTDVTDAPSIACTDPRHVETLDVSRSAFQGTSTIFPRLKYLRLTRMFAIDGSPSLLGSQLHSLMSNLTRLDLSGSGLASLEGADFMEAPHLKYLDLRGNQLTELPQSLLHLPFLETLYCGTNALTHFDTWNPSLCSIDLSYNKLSRLSLKNEEAMQMVNLKILQLCANSLDALPESLHLLPVLRELGVRHNMILNPLEAMTPTLHRLIASYNNPRLLAHRDSANSMRDSHDSIKYGTRYLPQMRQLKLEGLQTLELHETFSMASITSLDMRNTHMPYVHESLFQNAPNLQILNLSNNSLTRLPVSIRDLKFLEELYVSNNSLVDLPAALFDLQELRVLDVHANNLKLLPSRIMSAPKLKVLNLASNLITSLPADSASNNVTSLVQLTLCDNQLTEDCFEVILQLTTLRILDLCYNFITELPSRVYSQLPLLEELYLSGNRISTLPHDDFLYASNLRVLKLNSNKLHTLPAELSKATNLEVLDVAANHLRYNVANWPFDWNWRWNQKLRYLNFSSNKRLEIRKSQQYIDDTTGIVDLADFCILPKLSLLGLMDVTVTTNKVPFQTENCRVRTFGSDLQHFRVGIAESLGFRPLANNDLVLERFRNKDDELLVAIFDGHNELPGSGNKISHLAQDTFASMLKRELQAKDTTTVDALRRAFLVTHREIGNTALLSTEEIAHTSLGHHSSTASRLNQSDWSTGTGATVVFFQGEKMYIATVGGARVVLSRSNGTHTVLSKPLPPVSAELDRIRSSGGIVDPRTSYVNKISPYPRLIGCYTAGTVFSAAPSIYEYEFEAMNVTDQIIIGSSTMWEVMRHETAADIVRSSAQDPMLAAMKLRDFTTSYGMRDHVMALVVGRPWSQTPQAIGRQSSAGDLFEDDLPSFRYRRQSLPEDSTLARLGTEVSPPFGEVTMVFTDIKNSTYLWESYPSVMRAAIKTHNSLMRRSIRLMDGYEVKNEGDAFIVSFHTPVKALIWCLTVQQHLLTAEWPPELLEVDGCAPVHDDAGNVIFRGLSVRMGIHCGRPVAEPDPVTKRMDYFGPMVNRASRVSGIALGGQISVSSDFLNTLQRDMGAHKRVQEGMSMEEAYSYTKQSTAAARERSAAVLDHTEYVVKELGELKLRGIENPEHIYNIYPQALASRQKYYDENDTGERQNHGEIRPIAPSVSERAHSTDSAALESQPQNIDNAGVTASAVAASLGLPSVASLMGINPSGPASESLSIPGSPFVGPWDQDRRSSDGTFMLSRQSSRSSDTRDTRDLRVKHSLHLSPPGFQHAVEEPVDSACVAEQLQTVTRRLEAICVASSSGMKLHPTLQLLNQIDPPMQDDVRLGEIASLLWITRIENAIMRLQHHFQG